MGVFRVPYFFNLRSGLTKTFCLSLCYLLLCQKHMRRRRRKNCVTVMSRSEMMIPLIRNIDDWDLSDRRLTCSFITFDWS